MATNLVSLVMQFLTPDMITKIASAVGLDRMLAQKAIGGAVPAILASLADVASTPGGARQLSNAVAQQQPSALESLRNLTAGSAQKAFSDTGTSMLSGLLGGNVLDTLAQTIGRFAGLSEGTTKTLLGMLGPVIFGALGQHQRSTGLDASGLASLLTSQKDQIAAAVPAGLADQLSNAGLIDRAEDRISRATAASSATVSRMTRPPERTASYSTQWPYWLAGLVILGGLGWYAYDRAERDRVATLPPPVTTSQPTSGTVGVAPPSLTVGGVNLENRINSSVGSIRTTLNGITDTTSAEAALPKIRQTTTELNELAALSAQLSPQGKSAFARVVAAAMPSITPLFDKVLAMPGVGSIAKPAIDDLRSKLDTLAKA